MNTHYYNTGMSDTPRLPRIRELSVHQPFRWLERGARDIYVAPNASLAHGLAMTVGGWIIMLLGWQQLAVMAGAFSAFLLVAPVLATGLYEISRRIERGQDEVTLLQALSAWSRGGWVAWRMGLLLASIGLGWVAISTWALTVMAPDPVEGLRSFFSAKVLHAAAGDQRGLVFWLWLMGGGMLAALVFAISVVSLPLLIDREIGVREAITVSVEGVSTNPGVMCLWAVVIMLCTVIGIVTLVGLLVILPIVGHASWHAYTDMVEFDRWTRRASRRRPLSE